MKKNSVMMSTLPFREITVFVSVLLAVDAIFRMTQEVVDGGDGFIWLDL